MTLNDKIALHRETVRNCLTFTKYVLYYVWLGHAIRKVGHPEPPAMHFISGQLLQEIVL